MSQIAVAHHYRYLYPSELDEAGKRHRLRLATSGGVAPNPHFFNGRLLRPQRDATLLRGLMSVVQARYHVPPAMLTRILLESDPVVTAGSERLRFEGFAGCASVYARVDLLATAIDGELSNHGTTNVDFNPPMVAALGRIRDGDDVSLSVGSDEVRLQYGADSIVEKKVRLPTRWLKSFVEVQAYQARMEPVFSTSGTEAHRFLRSIPRSRTGRRGCCVVVAGRGLRMSQVPRGAHVRVGGIERLRPIESLALHAKQLQVFRDPASTASAWVLDFDDARFSIVLSPDVWRGFSGEGQVLADLATDAPEKLQRVRAALQWSTVIDPERLSQDSGFGDSDIGPTLARLGARGLVGYDLVDNAYFHRELPFDLSLIEALQPRLKNARKLVDERKVSIVSRTGTSAEAYVASSDVEHRVVINGDDERCSCPWYAKHHGERGPCKHVLAAKLYIDQNEAEL